MGLEGEQMVVEAPEEGPEEVVPDPQPQDPIPEAEQLADQDVQNQLQLQVPHWIRFRTRIW